jgi:hypothetical protein
MSGNDYGRFHLSNFTTSLSVDEVVKALRIQFEKSLETTPVTVGDLTVTLSKSITGHGGHRYWFICPSCGSRVAKLYAQPPLLACRHCFHIKYPSSRYKGMAEGDIGKDKGIM